MAKWTAARLERFDCEVHCQLCGRKLRSGKATILIEPNGAETLAGPDCARKALGDETVPTLDLTRLAQLVVIAQDSLSETPSPPSEPPESQQPRATARAVRAANDPVIDYVRLRVEAMAGFTGQATEKLRLLHSEICHEGLSDDGRLYVERLTSKAEGEGSIYSMANVRRCVAFNYWIRIAIDNTQIERREFLNSLLNKLKDQWRLSEGQVQAFNRWGASLKRTVPDFPVLDEKAFCGVKNTRYPAKRHEGG